jgi:hypothetical protein
MPHILSPDVIPHVALASRELGLTHRAMADLCGTSSRTVQRWFGGGSMPSHEQVHVLARAVFPRDAQIAAALAQHADTTLVALGLVPAPAPTVAAPPGPPPRAFPPVALMVDSILHAATQSIEAHAADPASHQAVLEITRAAFARARGLGLSLVEVDDALGAAIAAAPAQPAPRKSAGKA